MRLIVKDDTLVIIMACKLRDLREAAGITQADMGSMIGLSRVSYANIEAAEHGITATMLFKFCAILKCDYADLFPTPDEHQPEIFEIKIPTPEEKLAEKIRKMKQRLNAIERGARKGR